MENTIDDIQALSLLELALELLRARICKEDSAATSKRVELLQELGIRVGLLDADKRPTPLYFALVTDRVEQEARAMKGLHKMCACGCGEPQKLGEYASKECRFRLRLRHRKKRASR